MNTRQHEMLTSSLVGRDKCYLNGQTVEFYLQTQKIMWNRLVQLDKLHHNKVLPISFDLNSHTSISSRDSNLRITQTNSRFDHGSTLGVMFRTLIVNLYFHSWTLFVFPR